MAGPPWLAHLVGRSPCPVSDVGMGGGLADEESPESELVCVICHEVLLDPVTLLCGHNFDRMCMHKMLEHDNITACPTCRAPLPDTEPKV